MQVIRISSQPQEIYLDNAAITPLDPRVAQAMEPYFSERYANPSSMHTPGLRSRDALENARAIVARTLCCDPAEIIFTSSGTESINLALQGIARAHKNSPNGSRKHIMHSYRELMGLELLNDEKASAQFIKEFVAEWPQIKKSLLPFVEKLKLVWKEPRKDKERLEYLG